MESILDEALRRMDNAEEAPQDLLEYQTEIKKLDEYYSSQDWKDDYALDVEALKGYSVHPEHVAVADSKVRPYTKIRSCLDFEV